MAFEQRINKDAVERLTRMVDSDFVHMDYTDAIEILKNRRQFEHPVEWELICNLNMSAT